MTQQESIQFTYETLYSFACKVEDIRMNMLYSMEYPTDELAEQHFLLALASLDQAQHLLKLSGLYQRRSAR